MSKKTSTHHELIEIAKPLPAHASASDIAARIRRLHDESRIPSNCLDEAGRLLCDARDAGAFPGREWRKFRDLLYPSDHRLEPYQSITKSVVRHLQKHYALIGDEAAAKFVEGPASSGGCFNPDWVKTNLLLLADMIDAQAKIMARKAELIQPVETTPSMSETAAIEVSEDPTPAASTPAVAESKEVTWAEDDAFMPCKDAIEQSKGKLKPPGLSKLLTPTGPIRYMRSRQRCKVHCGDFSAYLRTIPATLSPNRKSEIAEAYICEIEEGKAAEQENKVRGT